jgi:hypothetical protein
MTLWAKVLPDKGFGWQTCNLSERWAKRKPVATNDSQLLNRAAQRSLRLSRRPQRDVEAGRIRAQLVQ